MSELKTTSLSHKDNNTGTPNITMYPDGTTSLSGVGGKVAGYQQGLWTPTFAQGSNNNLAATNYTNRTGNWWRIGNQVTVAMTLSMGSSAGISDTAAGLQIIDFPYKLKIQPYYYGSSSSVHANNWTDSSVVFVNILAIENSTRSNLYYATSTKTGIYGDVSYAVIGTGNIIGQITYLTDDTTFVPINGATVT